MDIFTQADEYIAHFLSQWNSTTVVLGVLLSLVIVHTLYTATEADIHPMMLQRQSQPDRVRNQGESAIYRAHDVPHGTPLRSGLNVKLPTDKPYAAGRDGDLRSIWQTVTGEIEAPRIPGLVRESGKQSIFTVLGKDRPTKHSIEEISTEIAAIGSYLAKGGSKRVAIHLPNSIEFLSSVFAASFYGLTIILLPFNQPEHVTIAHLKDTKADALVASAGSIALETITESTPLLQRVIWVVEKSSRHMDWTEVPRGLGKNMDVAMWHQIISDHPEEAKSLPEPESISLGQIVTIWQPKHGQPGTIVEFIHANFVAAIAALITAIPARERLGTKDLLLSADSWTKSYPLCQTLAALFSGASLAISSVAGVEADLTFASKNISPTIVISSSESVMKLHSAATPKVASGLAMLSHKLKFNTLTSGTFPAGSSSLASLSGVSQATIGSTPGILRLLFISERSGTSNPSISSQELNDLRLFTGARAIYALTAPAVAGAIAQTNMYDYRMESAVSAGSHFGAPLSSVEIKLVDSGHYRTTDEAAQGQIVVYGPAVAGHKAELGIIGTFKADCTLAYAA